MNIQIEQGSNRPIVFVFDESLDSVSNYSITLSIGNDILKNWGKEDIEIGDDYFICHMTQNETRRFPVGRAIIETKLMGSDGIVMFFDTFTAKIVKRIDKEVKL